MGTVIKKIEDWWAGLSSLLQVLLGITLGYFITAIFDFLFSKFGTAVTWWPVVIVLAFLREYFLNAYVGAALGGALFAALWPQIVSFSKRIAPLLRVAGTFIFLGFAAFVVPQLFDWWDERNDPRLFEMAPKLARVTQRMKMDFTPTEPNAFAALYREHTSIEADRLFKPSIGKWMAITGVVSDIETPTDNVNLDLFLYGFRTTAILNFSDKARGPIWKLQKRQRIRAICHLVTADVSSVGLNDCAIVPEK